MAARQTSLARARPTFALSSRSCCRASASSPSRLDGSLGAWSLAPRLTQAALGCHPHAPPHRRSPARETASSNVYADAVRSCSRPATSPSCPSYPSCRREPVRCSSAMGTSLACERWGWEPMPSRCSTKWQRGVAQRRHPESVRLTRQNVCAHQGRGPGGWFQAVASGVGLLECKYVSHNSVLSCFCFC